MYFRFAFLGIGRLHFCPPFSSGLHSQNKISVMGNSLPVLGMKPKRGWWNLFWLYFKIGLCSAISFKRFRRELSIDEAEHCFLSKNKGVLHFFSR